MQNASKVANGYKTILTNLMTKDLEEKFNEFGLTTRKQNGELKDSFTILKELSEKYKELGEAISEDGESTVSLNDDMNKLLKDISGTHNINVLTSGFDHFEQAINASNDALNSSGSAQEEYAVALDTIEKKLEALKGQFQQLFLKDGGLTSFIKTIIDLGTAILKFANSDVGQLTIKLTALAVGVKLLHKGFSFLGGSIVNAVKEIIKYQTALVAGSASTTAMYSSTKLLITGITEIGKAWAMSPFGKVALTIGAIVLITKSIDALFETEKEAREELQKASSDYEESSKNVNDISSKLDDLREKIKEINSEGGVDVARDGELQELILQTNELEAQLEIEKEKQRIASEKLEKKAEKTVYAVEEVQLTGTGEAVGKDKVQLLIEYSGQMKNLQDEMIKLEEEQNKLTISGETNSAEYRKNSEELNGLSQQYDTISDKSMNYYELLKEDTKDLSDNSETLAYAKEGMDAYSEVLQKGAESNNEFELSEEQKAEALREQAEEQEEALKEQEELTKEINQAYEDSITSVSGMDDAYSSLNDAIKEYNSTGTFSLDTLDDLLSMDSDYLSVLDFENGQVSMNEEGLYALANARIDEAEATAIQKAQNDLLNLTLMDTADAESQAGASANASVTGFDNAKVSIVELGVEASNSAVKVYELFNALKQQNGAIVTPYTSQAQQYTQALANQLNILENMRDNIGKNITATGKSTKSHDKNTGSRKRNADATKAQTSALKAHKKALEDERDALEDEIDEMEEIIDYMGELLERDKKAVEDERDAVLEAIDDKIEWLEKQKQKEHDIFQESIDIREKRKKEIEDYWDAEIEKVKQGNQVVEKNIELQKKQEALARAKTQKVKVLKDGKFVYQQDEEAVSKAEQELADYEMELSINQHISEMEQKKRDALAQIDEEIKVLKQSQEDTDNIYDQEIKDLQDLRAEKEAEYEARIDQFATYEAIYEGMLNRAKEDHMKILLEETGLEQGNWTTRLNNLATFIESYEGKKKSLDDIKDEIETVDSQIQKIEQASKDAQSSVNAISQDMQNTLDKIRYYKNEADKLKPKSIKYRAVGYSNGREMWDSKDLLFATSGDAMNHGMMTWFEQNPTLPNKKVWVEAVPQYNIGTYSMDKDQIALVGDPKNPSNREMVVGANINSGKGIMGSFDKGTGIIPSGQNFTESLVRLGRWENSGGIQKIMNNNSSSSQVSSIHIDNINLPNVKNPQDFVDYLENNFMNDAIQYASIRG